MEFYTEHPTPATAWRLAVLMGANTRTYKFALATALLEHAAVGRSEVTLAELAVPYARTIVEHARQMPQARGAAGLGESDFLAVAEAETEQTLASGAPTERLVDAAVRSMPAMVMQKFHNVAGGEVPHRFYELAGTGKNRVVVFTPQLRRVATSEELTSLHGEVDARWRIVETSFAAGVGASLITEGVAVDVAAGTITDKRRRRPITGVTQAVIGFQHQRCLICDELITPEDEMAVDHVFPFSLMTRGFPLGWQGLDLDAIWNLAPAHAVCNAAKSNALPTPAEVDRLARRNAAIMSSPHPLRRTLQLTLRSRGFHGNPEDWRGFLAGVATR